MPNNNTLTNNRTEPDVTSKKRRRAVFFGTVQIREHERIAGDHPEVTEGPSLALGWRSVDSKPVSLCKWESTRDKSTVLSPLTCDTRKFLLSFVFDVPSDHIKRSERIAARIQEQRRETLQELSKTVRRKKSIVARLADLPESMKQDTLCHTNDGTHGKLDADNDKPEVVVEDPLPRKLSTKHNTANKLLKRVGDARKRLIRQGTESYNRLQ